MKGYFEKGMVLGIIFLFLGACILPSLNAKQINYQKPEKIHPIGPTTFFFVRNIHITFSGETNWTGGFFGMIFKIFFIKFAGEATFAQINFTTLFGEEKSYTIGNSPIALRWCFGTTDLNNDLDGGYVQSNFALIISWDTHD
jgi:hypothetical protein